MDTEKKLNWSEHVAAIALARAAYARGDWRGYYVARRAIGACAGRAPSAECRAAVGPHMSEGRARRAIRRAIAVATANIVRGLVGA